MWTVHHLSVDIETYSSEDLTKTGLYKYAQSPDFEILLFAYSMDGEPVQVVDLTSGGTIPDSIEKALFDPCTIKHAYNAAFEWYCLCRHYDLPPYRAAELLPQWRCTMLHAQYCGFPASLADAGPAIGLPQDKQKLTIGKALIKYFCVPCSPTKVNGGRTRNLPHHDPDKWELFCEYNAQDVVTEIEIERRLRNFPVPDQVQRQWVLDQRINLRGVAIDRELVEAALRMTAEYNAGLVEEARRITGLPNPNSVAQLKGWLEDQVGHEIPDLAKSTVEDLLGEDDLPEKAERVLQIRQELGKTSLKKYDAIERAVCRDGRVRGMMAFYGANRTGREAGRLIQPQNLPHDTVPDEEMARELVKSGNSHGVAFAFGKTPHALSALIRTALVAEDGHLFVDADFSAIEARVIAWLAGESWVLEVFRTHGKIYEATASQMFGIPFEKIKKGNPEYSYRAKGKVATLALGYQGGPGALIAMGALKSGIQEGELQDIVNRWRDSNPHIKRLWYRLEQAAVTAINEGRAQTIPITGGSSVTLAREVDPDNGLDFLTMRLPSGRKLFYVKPHMGKNRFGNESICYWGLDGKSKKWSILETYAGKLAENCMAEGTLVLTERGPVPIETIKDSDRVWDGIEWVKHGGLIRKGEKPVVRIGGVKMTPDHKILTTEGWVKAIEADRLDMAAVREPDSRRQSAEQQAGKNSMELPVRLREDDNQGGFGFEERRATAVLRMYEKEVHIKRENEARNDKPSSLRSVALHEAEMHGANSSSVEELRWERNNCLPRMDEQLRRILEGYGPDVPEGSGLGQDKQRCRIQPGELPVGFQEGEHQKQEKNGVCGFRARTAPDNRNCGENGYREVDSRLQTEPQLARRIHVKKTGLSERVYDIRNCGPRNRFCVYDDGRLMLVHNCTQAVARDLLFYSMELLDDAGYKIVFSIHDEIVIEAPADKADLDDVVRIMSQTPSWAPGLPLNADGWTGPFFHKD